MEDFTLKPLPRATLPPRGKQLDLLRPGKDQTVTLIFLSTELALHCGHWSSGKTIACIGEDNGCPFCRPEVPSKTYGFAHVLCQDTGKEHCIMLTPDGCWNLMEAIQRFPGLRGFHCDMKRYLNRVTQPFVFIAKGFLDESRIGLPEKSCEPTIRRIWKTTADVDLRASRR